MSPTNGVSRSSCSKVSTPGKTRPACRVPAHAAPVCRPPTRQGSAAGRDSAAPSSEKWRVVSWLASRSSTSMRFCEYWRTVSKLLSGRRSGSLSDTRRACSRRPNRSTGAGCPAPSPGGPGHGRIDLFAPGVGVEGQPDAPTCGKEQRSLLAPRTPSARAGPSAASRSRMPRRAAVWSAPARSGAGIDGADRRLPGRKALLGGPWRRRRRCRTSGEGVAKLSSSRLLGANDDRRLGRSSSSMSENWRKDVSEKSPRRMRPPGGFPPPGTWRDPSASPATHQLPFRTR